MKHTLTRIFLCLVALLAVFGAWYVADPLLATLQGADPKNVKANANLPTYHLVVYVTYIMTVVVTWVTTKPYKHPYPPLMP